MGPFRQPPAVELGAAPVGLVREARRALRALPRGGRILSFGPVWMQPHVAGAVGSAGLLAAAAALVVAIASGSIAAAIGPVLLGGASLALVLRALDPAAVRRTLPASAVATAAKRALVGMARAAARSKRGACADAECERLLRRALRRAERADVALWIPEDVLGRAELLLARVVARTGGPRWSADEERRREVEELLRLAGGHLDDPGEAVRDLRIVESATETQRHGENFSVPPCLRGECWSADGDELDVEDEHAARRAGA